MIDEPPFGKALLRQGRPDLEHRLEEGYSSIAQRYASNGVKVNVDNMIATATVHGAAAIALNGTGLSAAETVATGALLNLAVHPFVYSAYAAAGHRVLSKLGFPQHSVGQEIAEGLSSGIAIGLGYQLAIAPIQMAMMHYGARPGITLLASNLLLTGAMWKPRRYIYVGIDNGVESLKRMWRRMRKNDGADA